MNKTNSFMHLLEQDLENRRGRDHPLWNFWIKDHLYAVKHVSHILHFFVRKYLPNSSGIRCLELGCGTGPASISIALDRNKVCGIDYKLGDPGLGLKLAKVRAKEHDVFIDFIQGDGYRLPFKDGAFDFIFCRQVIEHVENKDIFINEMYRVLSQDGVAYISIPNKLWYIEYHCGLLFAGLLPHDICKKYVKLRGRIRQENEWDVWHTNYWSFTRLLKRIGFKILANTNDYVEYKYPNCRKIRIIVWPIRYIAPMTFIVQK
jgi:ubiquinone/menaquinone biosynthesis C-methylase UbiE